MRFYVKVFHFIYICAFVACQIVNRPYSCVLPSMCRDTVTIVDPRIMGNAPAPPVPVPGSIPNFGSWIYTIPNECPLGHIRCSNVRCGIPSVVPGPQDGFATQSAFPWQAFIRNNNNLSVRGGYAAGGVLLDQYHVLTIGHKITNLTSISVILGLYRITDMTAIQIIPVAQVWLNMWYAQSFLRDDIAILRLATPAILGGNVIPICLAPAGSSYIGASSTSCVVSGWGQTSFTYNDAPTDVLAQVHVPIVSNEQCSASYTNLIGAANVAIFLEFPKQICAGGLAQQDACTQDGGSPLICQDYVTPNQFNLVGLVLWGKDCGQNGRYGVYLNVPAYIFWIQCTIQCIQGLVDCLSCSSRRFL